MSSFLDDMITDYSEMFNYNGNNLSKLKNAFFINYIKNRDKLLSELQKEVNIYVNNKSNIEKINNLKNLFWSIQTNDVITLDLDLDKYNTNCNYYDKCYRYSVEHNTSYKHRENTADHLASKIASFLEALDNKIIFKNKSRSRRNNKAMGIFAYSKNKSKNIYKTLKKRKPHKKRKPLKKRKPHKKRKTHKKRKPQQYKYII